MFSAAKAGERARAGATTETGSEKRRTLRKSSDRGAHCQFNNSSNTPSSSSAYAVENNESVKVQSDVYRR